MAPKKQPKTDDAPAKPKAASGVKRERAPKEQKEEEQKKKQQKGDDRQSSLLKFFGGGPKLPESKSNSESTPAAPAESAAESAASSQAQADQPMAEASVQENSSTECQTPTPSKASVAAESTSVEAVPAAQGSTSASTAETSNIELPIASQASPEPKVSGGLTEEQRKRIEANKKAAMEKKRKMEDAKASSPPSTTASEEVKPAPPPKEEPKPSPSSKACHPMFSPMRKEDKAPAKAPASAKATPKPKRAPLQNASNNTAPAAAPPPALLKEAAKTPEKTTTPEKRETVQPKAQVIIPPGRAGRFMTGAHTQWIQYHATYSGRLNGLRGLAMSNAKALWGKGPAPPHFSNQIKEYNFRNDGGEVVIVGTLCKEMKKRPDALADFKFRIGSIFGPMSTDLVYGESLCSEDDSFTIEDESLKVELEIPSERSARLCTGMVVSLKGVVLANGKFQVNDFSFPGLVAPAVLPSSQTSSGEIALISGLEFPLTNADSGDSEQKTAIERLIEWVQQKHGKGGLTRLIVCGGTLSAKTMADKATRLAAVIEADEFYSRLAAILPIDVVPSRTDPTNLSLPQRPMNQGLFKRSRAMKDFNCVTNPFETDIEGLRLLGHGGDPVKDVLRCTHIASGIEALETCLHARHLAPTAPDTLESAPCQDVDPFVIDEVPHVMFSGGHPKAEHKWCSASGSAAGTLCVCVPAFRSHAAVVTVGISDPRNIAVHEI